MRGVADNAGSRRLHVQNVAEETANTSEREGSQARSSRSRGSSQTRATEPPSSRDPSPGRHDDQYEHHILPPVTGRRGLPKSKVCVEAALYGFVKPQFYFFTTGSK